MLEKLKKEVFKANLDLLYYHLVLFTFGNVSSIDRSKELVVIKPSGVSYERMKASDMVVLDLSGCVVEGKLNPSSDTATHIELYKAFKDIGGVVHTHSSYATAWAQAGKSIPVLGTTHADYFYGSIPCTRKLRKKEIENAYEKNTGKVIVQTFRKMNSNHIPAILVNNHGPFTWGRDVHEAVHHAVMLESIAKTALHTIAINQNVSAIDQVLLNKHFLRKHGKKAYYGQK